MILHGGIGNSCCQMTQCDAKLHPWFQSPSVVGVFFYEEGDVFKKFFKHGWVDSQEVVKGFLIIQAEFLHQLMIVFHGYSPLGFQPVPHPTGSWSSLSFLLYHLIVLFLFFQQKLHEINIQHVKGCKVIHGSGQQSWSQEQMCTTKNLKPKWWASEETARIYTIPCPIILQT